MRLFRAGFVVVSMIFGTVAVAQETTVNMDEVQRVIRESEYHVTWQDQAVLPDLDAAWHATNRAQNLRFYFTEDGLRVVDRTAKGSPELLRLEVDLPLEGVSGCTAFEAEGSGLSIRHRNLVETFVNTQAGLEHTMLVSGPPTDDGLFRIPLLWSAAGLDVGSGVVTFRSSAGRRLVYSVAEALDANGARIEASLGLHGEQLVMTLADEDVAYPVSVKNLLTGSADTTLEGNSENLRFGKGFSSGDLNGDGFADVVAAADGWDGGQMNEGAVFVFLGSPTGIPSGSIAAVSNARIESNVADYWWPGDVAVVGDVNGDGYSDLAVGYIAWYPVSPGYWGAVWVFHGSATGISVTSMGEANTRIESSVADAYFGFWIDSAGDVNGDGYADLVVGAPYWSDDPLQSDEGAAFIFHGSGNGITATTTDQADSILEGNEPDIVAGLVVAGLGDVNGDGYDDVAVGIPYLSHPELDEGGVVVCQGSPTGIEGNPMQSLMIAADSLIEGNSPDALRNVQISGPGDVNGDGYGDLVAGNLYWGDIPSHVAEGVVVIYHGSVSGIVSNPTGSFVDVANSVIEGNPNPHSSLYLGSSVNEVGDVNGDGYADVVVGAAGFSNPETEEGALFLFYGGSNGVPSSRVDPVEEVADVVIESNEPYELLGDDRATGGDINGDGFSDLIFPLWGLDSPHLNAGAVFIYHGGADTLAQEADARHDFSVAGAAFGEAASNAGDLNGDGFSDIAVGAPFHDVLSDSEGSVHVFFGSIDQSLSSPDWSFNGQYFDGWTGVGVASAGDLNGDGFGDLVVGTSGASNPEIDEGRVDVFYGSVGGLSLSPDWYFESNLEYTGVGMAVSTAGDIDGDGYGDLIVGAPSYSNGQSSEGRAYVFFGSSMGLPSNPGWTYESDEADANLGFSVASAGDVNGDGFSDVIVGAFAYTSGELYEGAAYGFYGSENGLPAVPNWFIQTNRVGAHYGMSVAGIGDVNGDGFSDVIVGAPYDTNGEIQEGRAYIYHGSAGGLSTIADQVLEENIANASFGVDVAAAGDVNGDGFSDVMVGSPYTAIPGSLDGRASLYLGTAAGVGNDPGWLIGSTGTGDLLGYSAAGAGDVNGDGFSDVVVGSPYSDSGAADGGSIGLYFGNGGAGRPVLARQSRGAGDSIPVQPWGLSHSGDAFEVCMTATSPRGRELVKMHVEACPTGEVWGDLDCRHVVSADWTAIPLGEDGVVITESLTGLTEDVLYHWRAHALYVPLHTDAPGITPPPVPRHGPWRSLFAQAPAADIRVGVPQEITIELEAVASSVAEGAPQVEVEVVVTTSDGLPTEVDCEANFETFNGTAFAGEDYVSTSGNTFYYAGTLTGTAQILPVGLMNDDLDEPDEDFVVEITNPFGAVLGPQTIHTVTILDDDPPPELSAADVEIDEGAGFVRVILELSTPTSFEVTVNYATADGTANTPLDYGYVSGTATLPPMETVFNIDIPIEDDWAEETPEEFTIELTSPTHAVLNTPTVTITILDNDAGIIFADGFESGGTGGWSRVVP